MRIVNHVNVYNSCLILMQQQGWTVTTSVVPYEDDEQGVQSYTATRACVELVADNPLELLGLTNLVDAAEPSEQPCWWVVDGPNVLDRILDNALTAAFWEYRDRSPWRWAERVRTALDDAHAAATDALGVSAAQLDRAMALLRDETDIGTIVVQFYPERIGRVTKPGALHDWLNAIDPDTRRFDSAAGCSSFYVRVANPSAAWAQIAEKTTREPPLAAALVVAYCAAAGWQDAVLLHHFDEDEATRPFPDA